MARSTLEDDLLVDCVRVAIESILSAVPKDNTTTTSSESLPTTATKSRIFTRIEPPEISDEVIEATLRILSLLHRKSVPAQDAARLSRCIARILPKQPSNEQLSLIIHILNSVCKKAMDNENKCAYSQECALWFLWFYLLKPHLAEAANVCFVDTYLAKWNKLSCTLLSQWSSSLRPIDLNMASRLTCQLIRLASICQVDAFKVLSSLKVIITSPSSS